MASRLCPRKFDGLCFLQTEMVALCFVFLSLLFLRLGWQCPALFVRMKYAFNGLCLQQKPSFIVGKLVDSSSDDYLRFPLESKEAIARNWVSQLGLPDGDSSVPLFGQSTPGLCWRASARISAHPAVFGLCVLALLPPWFPHFVKRQG